uniref:Uncharacterized protein n=1 Tax=Panagrolaimus sp. PS1159 TaxID=55785 RepID=A0AC35GLL4_9BILA
MGKQREPEMAKLEKDKKRLETVEPLPKKIKKAARKKKSESPQRKIEMAPGIENRAEKVGRPGP